jgi:hypothetical protein
VTTLSARSAQANLSALQRLSTKSGDPSREACTVEVAEPRCRVCRDPEVRRLVNDLLDWRGVPIPVGGRLRRVTYTEILAKLKPMNEGRPLGDQITYDSLWVHAKRHHGLTGIVAYWSARMDRELREALQALGGREPDDKG